jgi:hypothetical protein
MNKIDATAHVRKDPLNDDSYQKICDHLSGATILKVPFGSCYCQSECVKLVRYREQERLIIGNIYSSAV